jgi:hypothetical protein
MHRSIKVKVEILDMEVKLTQNWEWDSE